MTRDELLQRIRQERARLDEVLSRIPEDRLLQSPDGDWSGKDLLAHIAAWQRIALARVTGGDDDAILGWTAGESEHKDIDAINERIHELRRDSSLDDVRVEFGASYDQLCAAIEALNDAQVGAPWLGEQTDRGSLAQMVAANTFEHYEEHIGAFNSLAAE